jgi:hypothetical protein
MISGEPLSEPAQQWPTPPSEPARPALCRTDGRCQYAIDHGAEGMGHCPAGQCCTPAQPLTEREDYRPQVLHECLDNDSPWLICKHCGAVGRCELEKP